MKNFDCSVVIPVYNVKKYIVKCLESLPLNSLKIIIINDGSTDGSDAICKQFAMGKDNIFVYNKLNGGLSDARNYGMQFVDTEFVFFLDSDDWLNPFHLVDAIKFAKEHQLDWTQCGYAYAYEDYALYNREFDNNKLIDKEFAFVNLVSDGIIKNFAWGKIYRTKCIKDKLFPVGKFYEDSYWQYKIIESCTNFGIFSKITFYYRQRNDSISGVVSLRFLDLIEGTKERIDYFRLARPDLAIPAAFNLWKMVNDVKRHSDDITYKILFNIENDIKNNYSDEIQEYLKSLKGWKRITQRNIFYDKSISKLFELITKVVNRLKTSEYIKISL